MCTILLTGRAGSATTDEQRITGADDSSPGAPTAWDSSVERTVGSRLREAVDTGRNSAGVLIFVRDGAVRIAEGFGVEGPGGPPVTASNSRFVLNSISKAFVAVSLSQLKSSGRIHSYDDPANRYLHTYRLPDSAGREITLGQLATHTAGIDEAVFDMEAESVIDRGPTGADYRSHQPRYFVAPGLMPVYSELGIDLLGLVIADVAKETYAEYLGSAVLGPFGMSKTTVGYPRDGKIAHLVTAYQPGSPANVEPMLYSTPLTLPDGGVISTGEDMGRFMLEVTRGSYADVFQIHQSLNPSFIAYGIVFEVTRIRGQPVAYHRGGGRGTDCIVAFALATNASLFECATTIKPVRGTPANRRPVPHEELDLAVFDSLVPAAAEARESVAMPVASTPTDTTAWKDYVGDYIGTSRHHDGIGRLRSLLHPYGVRVRRQADGLQIDGAEGFREFAPGQFSSPNALEVFTFLKSPVDGRVLLSRSLDGTPFEKPRLRDDPRVIDGLLAAFVAVAASGLLAPYWPRAARPGAARPRDFAARIAAVGFAFVAVGGVGVVYGFHTFGVRYSTGVAWPLWLIRAGGFLVIPIALVLTFAWATGAAKLDAVDTRRMVHWSCRLHLAVLAIDAIAGVALLTSVGVIGVITQ